MSSQQCRQPSEQRRRYRLREIDDGGAHAFGASPQTRVHHVEPRGIHRWKRAAQPTRGHEHERRRRGQVGQQHGRNQRRGRKEIGARAHLHARRDAALCNHAVGQQTRYQHARDRTQPDHHHECAGHRLGQVEVRAREYHHERPQPGEIEITECRRDDQHPVRWQRQDVFHRRPDAHLRRGVAQDQGFVGLDALVAHHVPDADAISHRLF